MIGVRRLPATLEWNVFSFKIALAIFAVYFIWGSTYLALAMVVDHMPPFLLNGIRFMIAGSLLFVVLRLSGVPMPTRRQWRNAFLVGSLMTGLASGLLPYAMQSISSGLAALGIASIPLWTALFGSFVEQRPNGMQLGGLLVGFVGVVILNVSREMWGNPWGGLALLLSPILWSFGTILSRHLDVPKGVMNSPVILFCGGLVLTVLGLLNGERLTEVPPPDALLAWSYLIFFGSIIAFSAYNFLLQNTQAVVATSYAYVNPVVAVFLGWLILGEKITLQALIAGTLIIASVVIITTNRHRPKPRLTQAIEASS